MCERERELETVHSDLDTSKRAYLDEFLLVHEFDQDGDQSDQIPQLQLNPLCGGINPYTLTAKIGPAQISGSGPPKDNAWPGQPVWSPAQGVKTDLATKISVG